ncbi:unnamed protein product, partial [Scytosiphon promiscuus]
MRSTCTGVDVAGVHGMRAGNGMAHSHGYEWPDTRREAGVLSSSPPPLLPVGVDKRSGATSTARQP